MKTILVTGAAGFIGFHASQELLKQGHRIIGIDSLNDYYDVNLKKARLQELSNFPEFSFFDLDLMKYEKIHKTLQPFKITHILHLGGQAGVRYSLDNPRAYINANIMGHLNILELARHTDSFEHLVYASSSSVYGDRKGGPFTETDQVRSPASLYAATKLSGELLGESYHHLYKIPQTGLRFFTVYGPWGRPDMAYYIFVHKIFNDEPITLFAPEEMCRDFTYIDDIVDVLPKILETPPENGHALYNLGNSKPNTLMQMVDIIENACGRKAEKIILGKQKGDVNSTYANISAAQDDFGFNPIITLETGIPKFVNWYRDYYKV